MAGHTGQGDDDPRLDPAGVDPDDPDATAPPAGTSGQSGGDARPVSLLGLRLTDTQSPRNATVSRRTSRTRPPAPRPDVGGDHPDTHGAEHSATQPPGRADPRAATPGHPGATRPPRARPPLGRQPPAPEPPTPPASDPQYPPADPSAAPSSYSPYPSQPPYPPQSYDPQSYDPQSNGQPSPYDPPSSYGQPSSYEQPPSYSLPQPPNRPYQSTDPEGRAGWPPPADGWTSPSQPWPPQDTARFPTGSPAAAPGEPAAPPQPVAGPGWTPDLTSLPSPPAPTRPVPAAPNGPLPLPPATVHETPGPLPPSPPLPPSLQSPPSLQLPAVLPGGAAGPPLPPGGVLLPHPEEPTYLSAREPSAARPDRDRVVPTGWGSLLLPDGSLRPVPGSRSDPADGPTASPAPSSGAPSTPHRGFPAGPPTSSSPLREPLPSSPPPGADWGAMTVLVPAAGQFPVSPAGSDAAKPAPPADARRDRPTLAQEAQSGVPGQASERPEGAGEPGGSGSPADWPTGGVVAVPEGQVGPAGVAPGLPVPAESTTALPPWLVGPASPSAAWVTPPGSAPEEPLPYPDVTPTVRPAQSPTGSQAVPAYRTGGSPADAAAGRASSGPPGPSSADRWWLTGPPAELPPRPVPSTPSSYSAPAAYAAPAIRPTPSAVPQPPGSAVFPGSAALPGATPSAVPTASSASAGPPLPSGRPALPGPTPPDALASGGGLPALPFSSSAAAPWAEPGRMTAARDDGWPVGPGTGIAAGQPAAAGDGSTGGATTAAPGPLAPSPLAAGPVAPNLPARRWGALSERLTGAVTPTRRAMTVGRPVPVAAESDGPVYARPRAGGRRVLVGGFGGGGGRTTVAAGLGLAMAAHHGHRVVAVDASPDQCGLLAHRVGLIPPGVGLRELAGARPPVSSLEAVRRYLASDGTGGLEVLAGLRDLVGPGLLPEELAWALDLLGHWYPVVVADAPSGWSQPVPATLLARADLLVLTVRAGETEIAGADDALNALVSAGRADLVATVVVAVVETYPSRLSRSARLRLDHLEERAYITVSVPFDPALADSRPINWFRLRRRTRFAFQRLAGAIATAPLPGSHPAMVLSRPSPPVGDHTALGPAPASVWPGT